ncbi:hypothetical protein D556_0932 [Bordetella holmesii 41130]|nr:hypothetical protein D556_0932 [Bordetella holmesii 41130]
MDAQRVDTALVAADDGMGKDGNGGRRAHEQTPTVIMPPMLRGGVDHNKRVFFMK